MSSAVPIQSSSTASDDNDVVLDGSGGGGGTNPLRMLKAVFSRKRTSVESAINQTYLLNLQLYEIDGSNSPTYHRLLDERNLQVTSSTLANKDAQLPPIPVETRIRFTPIPYDSSTTTTKATTGWIEASYNGVVIARLSPVNSYHANKTGLDYGGTFTTAGFPKFHGICFEGGGYNDAGTTLSGLPTHAFGGRFVRPQSAVTPPLNPGASDVVAFTANQVDVGTLGVDTTLTTCTNTASALAGREVQAASFLTTITAISGSPRTYVFCVDGTTCRIIDPIGRTVNNWTNTTGVTPYELCRVIGFWRGRPFVGNYDGNPTFWALGKICRASDDIVGATLWTTGGTEPTRAFSGTASDSPGVSGSAITGFTEIDNGRAVMFCASEVYMFDGDPGYGGRLVCISKETGCLGPRAFAFDEEGNLYFVGPAGLFMMQAGTTQVKNIMGDRLNSILGRIDTSTTLVQLVYDSLKRELRIFLTPRDLVTQGTHGVFDTARNAPWKDRMPVRLGPLGVCKITGEAPDERRFIMIGTDGYVRRPVFDRRNDDGDAIDWYVRLPTIESDDGTHRISIVELQGTGSPGCGQVDWEVRTGRSAIDVARQDLDSVDPAASGTWFTDKDGAQPPVRMRAGGDALQVVLRQESASSSASMERVTARTKDLGPRRL